MGHTGAYIINSFLPVHPHLRGAYGGRAAGSGLNVGSSPHTWGIQHPKAFQVSVSRFIPTYVGHTPHRPGGSESCPVHPHIRGAYKKYASVSGDRIGSSPHTWGIQAPDINGAVYRRFIPTYVGHTHWVHFRFLGFPVHPHIRGAYP